MSLTSIISYLATTGAAVSGVTSSFDVDDIPDSLSSAQLPALLHFPAGGTHEAQVFDRGKFWIYRHTVRVVLLYKASGQGRLEDNLGGIVTLYDAYQAAMRSNHNLTSTICDATVARYDEPAQIEYAGIPYDGMMFYVEVTEYVQ